MEQIINRMEGLSQMVAEGEPVAFRVFRDRRVPVDLRGRL